MIQRPGRSASRQHLQLPRSLLLLLLPLLLLAPALVSSSPSFPILTDVNFYHSCRSSVNGTLNTAISYLHSFWYPQARLYFRQVREIDSGCALAAWGEAMTLWHPLWVWPGEAELSEGAALISIAQRLGKNATARENAYINAGAAFFLSNTTVPERASAFYRAHQGIFQSYGGQDLEAGVFLALGFLADRMSNIKLDKATPGVGFPNWGPSREIGKLLEYLQTKQPLHPGILHYLIHVYDIADLAPLGLQAARAYGPSALKVPHALHMPGHIFNKLGLWNESVLGNWASFLIAKAEETDPNKLNNEATHAYNYLTYALAQLAADEAYAALVATLPSVQAEAYDDLLFLSARYVLEKKDWAAAASFYPQPAQADWASLGFAQVVIELVRAYGNGHVKNLTALREGVVRAEAAYKAWLQSDTYKEWPQTYWDEVEMFYLMTKAWLTYCEGNTTGAIAVLRDQVSLDFSGYLYEIPLVLPDDLLAEWLLELKRPAEALVVASHSLQVYPNRFWALHYAAESAAALGNEAMASHYSQQLLSLCDMALNGTLPSIQGAPVNCGPRPEFSAARTRLQGSKPWLPRWGELGIAAALGAVLASSVFGIVWAMQRRKRSRYVAKGEKLFLPLQSD